MKYELPCEVVYELMPMYADNLLGENVKASVAAHLESCEACNSKYTAMIDNDIKEEQKNNSKYKSILKKTKSKILKIIICCIFVFIVVFSAVWFLVNYSTTAFHVPVDDITVTIDRVSIDDLNLRKANDDSNAYMIGTYGIDGDFVISEENYNLLLKQGYIQYLVIDSDIRIMDAYIDRYSDDGTAVLEAYAYHFKTDKPDYYKNKEFILYDNIDKLVYFSNNQEENGKVLWSNTDK